MTIFWRVLRKGCPHSKEELEVVLAETSCFIQMICKEVWRETVLSHWCASFSSTVVSIKGRVVALSSSVYRQTRQFGSRVWWMLFCWMLHHDGDSSLHVTAACFPECPQQKWRGSLQTKMSRWLNGVEGSGGSRTSTFTDFRPQDIQKWLTRYWTKMILEVDSISSLITNMSKVPNYLNFNTIQTNYFSFF